MEAGSACIGTVARERNTEERPDKRGAKYDRQRMMMMMMWV